MPLERLLYTIVCGSWGVGCWPVLPRRHVQLGDCFGSADRYRSLCGLDFHHWVAFKAVSVLIDLRVSTTDEQRGLDFSEHHEVGYPEFQATLHN